jgi:hypothetical protein
MLCWGNQNEREHLEDVGVDERIKLNIKSTWGGLDAINVFQDGDNQAVVNTVINLRFL